MVRVRARVMVRIKARVRVRLAESFLAIKCGNLCYCLVLGSFLFVTYFSPFCPSSDLDMKKFSRSPQNSKYSLTVRLEVK